MDQALRHADTLRRRHNTIWTTSALSDEEARELGLEDRTEALSLASGHVLPLVALE
jgi:hypothetical protein